MYLSILWIIWFIWISFILIRMLICFDTVHLFNIVSQKGINLIDEIENATHFDKCYILTITLCWCEASVVMLLSQASIWLDWLQLLGRYISVCFQHIMLSWGPAHWAVGLATTVVGTQSIGLYIVTLATWAPCLFAVGVTVYYIR